MLCPSFVTTSAVGGGGPNGRVFMGPKGARRGAATSTGRGRRRRRRRASIPEVGLHFHDLRHTGNNLTRGASLKDVMRRLGHASTRAALIYQHADRDSERAIAAGLSRDDPGGPVRRVRARSGHGGLWANVRGRPARPREAL